MSDRKWHVLRVTPNQELKAEKQVRQLGYEAIAPYDVKLARRGKSRHQRPWKFALYPGYLFASWANWWEGWSRIQGEAANPLEKIASIYGYLHPVWTPMPYILPASDTEHLLSIADGKYKREVHEAPRLKVGNEVIIPEGPFEGRRGTLTKIRGKKATVEVRGEKIVVPIEIELADLQKM